MVSPDLEKVGSMASAEPNIFSDYPPILSCSPHIFTKVYQSLPKFTKFTNFYKKITKVYQILPEFYQMWDLRSLRPLTVGQHQADCPTWDAYLRVQCWPSKIWKYKRNFFFLYCWKRSQKYLDQ